MPRIPFSVVLKAHRENHLLSILLKECRTIDSARNELRWLRERAIRHSQSHPSKTGWKSQLKSMVQLRSRGYPLQYILGDQPFGELEILCRKGVLIPRPETESYTYQAAKLVRRMRETNKSKSEKPLRVIDLCTGTGCISLLLHALLAPHFQNISITGIDISPTALSLAQKNLQHNLKLGQLTHSATREIHFHRADVLGHGSDSTPPIKTLLQSLRAKSKPDSTDPQCDLLISNPPYISRTEFRNGTTARSVRLFEPELALVPPESGSVDCRPEDIFYYRIINLASELQAKISVLECGDMAQAQRVVALHSRLSSGDRFSAEVWPSLECDLAEYGFHKADGSRCVIIQRLR